MPYSVNMMLCPPSTQLALKGNDYQGFPRPFRYFLLSMWGCVSPDPRTVSFENPNFFSVQANNTQMRVYFLPSLSASPSIDAFYSYPASNVLRHFLVSLDGVAQIAQVYINDVPAVLSSGGWVGPPNQFDISGMSFNTWELNSSGSSAPGPGQGDVFAAAPAAFFDLTVTANRRKFINADLTPVDLGATATSVLGVAPQIWLTARSGVPTDFPINHGSGGGTWTDLVTVPFSFQTEGVCVAPVAGPGPGLTRLAMDNVACDVAVAGAAPCELCLDWSNDRGHTFGVPVCQPMNSWGFLTSLQWQRLGMARDRVFRLTWTCAEHTALQGAWITAITGDEDNEMAGQGRG